MPLLNYKRRAEGVKFEGETFSGLDLRSMKAFGSTWRGCVFKDCKLDLTDWRASRFVECTFVSCSMNLINFATSFIEDCVFSMCEMEQASFMGCQLSNVSFFHSRMAYGETMFQDVTGRVSVEFHDCNLHGSNLDFREMEPGCLYLKNCNLTNVRVSMGCAFFAATFDEETAQKMLSLVAYRYPNPETRRKLIDMAGTEYPVVERAMGCNQTSRTPMKEASRLMTIQPEENGTKILSFTGQTDTTPKTTT